MQLMNPFNLVYFFNFFCYIINIYSLRNSKHEYVQCFFYDAVSSMYDYQANYYADYRIYNIPSGEYYNNARYQNTKPSKCVFQQMPENAFDVDILVFGFPHP